MVGLLRFISGGKKYTNKLLFWICVPLRKPRSVTEMISKDECEHFCAVALIFARASTYICVVSDTEYTHECLIIITIQIEQWHFCWLI